MWFDGVRQPDTLYVASVSRGKDSTAMLRAIQLMGWPLDMIASVDIWATKDIPAELPPMVKFKEEWDRKCLEVFGVPVTRLCAEKNGEKISYEDMFYKEVTPERLREREREGETEPRRGSRQTEITDSTDSRVLSEQEGLGVRTDSKLACSRFPDSKRQLVHGTQNWRVYGFPTLKGSWCNSTFKTKPLNMRETTRSKNIVHYIGIAADEPIRVERHINRPNYVLPLVQIGWDEDLCGLEATYLDMLSPTYNGGYRDGCWFCHNQGVAQLRRLRKEYPELWKKLLEWDSDSPTTFRPDGHTVHDYDERFRWEDEGYIDPCERFQWAMIDGTKGVQLKLEEESWDKKNESLNT